MLVEFEYVEIDEGHVVVTDEMGVRHEIPEYMCSEDFSVCEVGEHIEIDLPITFITDNDIFV